MKQILAMLTVVLSVNSALAADSDFPGIEALMSTAEQRTAGIENLTPQQLEALNAWIARYATGAVQEAVASAPTNPTPAPAPAPAVATNAVAGNTVAAAPTDDFGTPAEKIDFVSRIDGEFAGWSGHTLFTLENGQVWEQRRGSRWKVSLDRPEVRIYENFMGAFEMEVLSAGRSIGVRRIR